MKQMMNIPGANEGKKVFYNTSSLQLKNSLSNSIRAKSYGHQNRIRVNANGTRVMSGNTVSARNAVSPEVAAMRDIQAKLKTENIRETVLMKKPTHADLKDALIKHRDKLDTFYQKKDIKKITED